MQVHQTESTTVAVVQEQQQVASLPEIEALREENKQLKQVAQFLARHRQALQLEIADKKLSPSKKRELAQEISVKYSISLRQACRLLGLARSTCWYVQPGKAKSSVVIAGAMPGAKDANEEF